MGKKKESKKECCNKLEDCKTKVKTICNQQLSDIDKRGNKLDNLQKRCKSDLKKPNLTKAPESCKENNRIAKIQNEQVSNFIKSFPDKREPCK